LFVITGEIDGVGFSTSIVGFNAFVCVVVNEADGVYCVYMFVVDDFGGVAVVCKAIIVGIVVGDDGCLGKEGVGDD